MTAYLRSPKATICSNGWGPLRAALAQCVLLGVHAPTPRCASGADRMGVTVIIVLQAYEDLVYKLILKFPSNYPCVPP
jgi:hypothetical protein